MNPNALGVTQTPQTAINPLLADARPSALRLGVLVADDDQEIRDALDEGLRHEGFDVWLAADGQEAVNTYVRNAALIVVAILDVRMPVLDGPHTFALLKQVNPRVLCCFMSGQLGGYTSDGLRGMGASTIFWKPFHLADVAQTLRGLAAHPSPYAEQSNNESSSNGTALIGSALSSGKEATGPPRSSRMKSRRLDGGGFV